MFNNMKKATMRALRIEHIEKYDDIPDVNFFLIREYFRRVAIMFSFLEGKHTPSPRFDCCRILGIECQQSIGMEIDKLRSTLIEKTGNAYIAAYLIEYIKWNYFIDLKNAIAVKNRDVFEPLIRIFENGCTIGFHHGEFMVGKYSLGKINVAKEITNKPFIFT
ncbi:hypothetical protein SOASR030_04690 [Leminorella grimontii]|uniref:Uncharacterized protein n=1 Tax=Leminorella grimontii TaxID=82981 RepID=A0AAV5N111_9GAMM|nr:hypothetical protein [Leminorella grimontii]KFC96452.1 hypothetical protein GLGR_1628 [Leminorella grimontii ATCC 33999 = DSM 5078]GKX54357.1 hypothetical protein SOASR030_04690 [Leminorella grimontii]VFS59490.1 Uncharacterised protein [Leminorella grimontii]